MNRPYLRDSSFALLRALYPLQRQPLKLAQISKRAALSKPTCCTLLRQLEQLGYVAIDRREKPYSYELSPEAIAHLLSSRLVYAR